MGFFFFKRTTTTRLLFFLIFDALLISVSIYFSFLLRFDGAVLAEYLDGQEIQKVIIWTLSFCLPFFYLFGLYSFSWSYVSTQELVSLFKATTISFLFLGITISLSKEFPFFIGFPRSVFVISYFLIFIFCGGLRLSKKIYLIVVGRNNESDRERTLIVGAGDAGEQILRSIISSNKSPYHPIGLVDDNPIKKGVSIHNLKVLGKICDIPIIVKSFQIKQLIIALPSADGKKIKEAVEFGKKAGVWKIKIAPPLSEIIKGQVSFKSLKDVEVEDLLGRKEVVLDKKQIDEFIKNKKVIVTGAAGSIGSELCRQIVKFSPKLLILLDQDETGIFHISRELKSDFSQLEIESLVCDITDKNKISKVFEKFSPEIIFHAAAYKHVPLMEDNCDEAVKNNIFGTKILAEAGLAFGAEKFIFISTDKAVNPTSVMGATKRAGEMLCQLLNGRGKTRFVSVRFGNVLNSRGSVIPIFREQIKKGGPVEVTHPEMKRYFMLTSEACLLVMQAGAMGQGGEVFVLDMGQPIKIIDLAKEMIKLSGLQLDKDIAIVFIGKRPGEKLFEEILTSEEGVLATKNQKIFVAKLSAINLGKLEEDLKILESIIIKDSKDGVVDFLKRLVPFYEI